jgi:prepilin-type N-terminal cleavage/methylation domain-containing protein
MIMITPSFSTVSASTRSPDRLRRDGFTLVEILVVILIIAIMASLITAVIGNSLNSARAAATRATITKVHRLLEERRQAIARSNLRTEIRVVRKSMAAPELYAPQVRPGLNSNDVARIVAFKETMRAHFPQRIKDLSGPDRDFHTSDDSPVLTQLKKLNPSFSANPPAFPSGHTMTTTSSELLYVALTMGTELGSGGTAIDFNSSEVVDSDRDGLMELVDGWGHPLRFYRWPTDLVRAFPNSVPRPVELLIDGGNPQLWNKDPDDPIGRFSKWLSNSNVNTHGKVQGRFHWPSTFHVPLVVSAGQDGELFLNEPHTDIGEWAMPTTADPTKLSDSITNRNISIGGN